MSVVVGFNWPAEHDNCVAAIVDGRLVFASEEERYTRHKHSIGEAPSNALIRAFAHLESNFGINPTDIKYYAVNWDPRLLKIDQRFAMLLESCWRSAKELGMRGVSWELASGILSSYRNYLDIAVNGFLVPTFRKLNLDFPKEAKIIPVEHHLTHAASAYYFSGFNKAAAITVDGAGEKAATVVWRVADGDFEKIAETDVRHGSIGLLYEFESQTMGFSLMEGPGKVMGLAPYGKANPIIVERLEKAIHLAGTGRMPYEFVQDVNAGGSRYLLHQRLAERIAAGLNLKWVPHGEIVPDVADLAWCLQDRCEQLMLHIATWTREKTSEKDLALAGGVAMNAKASMRVHYSKLYQKMFVFPAANDAGGAVGAAAYVYHHYVGTNINQSLAQVYLGPTYSDAEVRNAVTTGKWRAEQIGEDTSPIARIVADGGVVAWYQGRAELGPRALGNRSIVADPTRVEMWKVVNAIKGREWWRPLAPSLLFEDMQEYLVEPVHNQFMTLMFQMPENAKSVVPAVCHVDGTTRPQTVKRTENGTWYDLIKSFKDIKGEGLVVNTSFNLAGEPLVETPRDAIRSFAVGGFDALYLQGWLVRKH